MNLEESDLFREELESTAKKKKIVVFSIILCAIMIVLLIALIITILKKDATTEKFYLDGTQISKPDNLYLDVDGVTYVDVEGFLSLLQSSKSSTIKYTTEAGHYGLYDEDEESILIDNGYETLEISADNNYYKKYIDKAAPDDPLISTVEVSIKSEYGYSEKFSMENPVRYINEEIYVPLENIPEMFNIRIEWKEYRKKIYTFENIVASAITEISKIGTNQVMSGYYENLKALVYGYAVLQTDDETNYGVYSLSTGTNVLSSKYSDITFVQNSQEFYVTTEEGTMGLVSASGDTIIKTSEGYSEISLLDDDSQLYLVEKNGEYGVINRSGKTVIYTEYDGIGYDTTEFTLETIENSSLLGGKCIPVEKNKKYGLYNTDGEQILNNSFDSLGYISTSTSKKAGEEESILMIPKSEGVNGIVINQGDLYGIFDIDDEELFLPCSFTKIYAIRKSGQIIYYLEYGGEKYVLKDYLKELGIAKNFDMIEEDDDETTDEEDTNTVTTDNTTNTVSNETEVNSSNEKTNVVETEDEETTVEVEL